MTKATNVSVALSAIEIEHILLALSCFDSEVDEHFRVTEKLISALAMSREKALFPMKSGGEVEVTGIMWDIDYDADDNDLPTETIYTLREDMDSLEELECEISEWLSNQWGFCHNGFSIATGKGKFDAL